MTTSPPEIQLCLLSQPRLLGAVRALLETFAERVGVGETQRGELVLAVDEAMTNIIRHGYEHAADGRIWLSLREIAAPRRGVRIEIEDHQTPFDPEEVRGRALEEVRPGGLGLHLIRQLAHVRCHEPRAEGGMRLVIEKFCDDAVAGGNPTSEPTRGAAR